MMELVSYVILDMYKISYLPLLPLHPCVRNDNPHEQDISQLTISSDFIPIYYQACKGSSPLVSGLQTLGLACIAPSAIVGGIIVTASQKYRPPIWCGWCLCILGTALLSTVRYNTAASVTVGYSVLLGCGIG